MKAEVLPPVASGNRIVGNGEVRDRRHVGTTNLIKGDPELWRKRRVPLNVRVASHAASTVGEDLGKLTLDILEGMRRKQIPVAIGKIVLERLLPSGRPVQLDLPQIDSGPALARAEARITDALNAGAISPGEARTLQAWAKQSWRSRKIARTDRT